MVFPLILLVSAAVASSFYEQPFPEAVRGAPTIVRGKIGKSESQWTALPDGSRHLFTYYDVDVGEGLKGAAPNGPIRIRELGGTKDGVSLNVSGTAGFDKGEEVVVLLGEMNSQGDGAYPVMGMMMGKFNLEKGADGKEYLRGPGLGSERLKEKTPQISLDGLREMIRAQQSEPKAIPTPSPSSSPIQSSGLFSDRESRSLGPKSELHDESLGKGETKATNLVRPLVLVLGVLIGGVAFLKSRKKRR